MYRIWIKETKKIEAKLAKKCCLEENYYEWKHSGELVHFDNAKLPVIKGDSNKKRVYLHIAVDDYSRYSVADIFPDKTQYSSAIHLEETILAMPFGTTASYSDNGREYKKTQWT